MVLCEDVQTCVRVLLAVSKAYTLSIDKEVKWPIVANARILVIFRCQYRKYLGLCI